MNILMMVGGVLVIVVIGVTCIAGSARASIEKQQQFVQFLDLERRAQNGAESYLFKLEKKKEKSTTKTSGTKRRLTFTRDRIDPYEDSKLNIGPLFIKPRPAFYDRLYEIAAAKLRILYSKSTLHLKEGVEYQILDAMIEEAKEKKDTLSFDQLIPENEKLKPLFIKMVKGTRHYSIPEPHGYPPLEDFFLVNCEKTRAPIIFSFASKPLLQALFGLELTDKIMEKEEEKKRALDGPTLEALLLQNGISSLELQGLFSFASKPSHPLSRYTLMEQKSKMSRKVRQLNRKGASSS